jgi:hypothetical protein
LHRWIDIKDKQPEEGTVIVCLMSWDNPYSIFEDNICIWQYQPGQLKTMTHWMVLRPPVKRRKQNGIR